MGEALFFKLKSMNNLKFILTTTCTMVLFFTVNAQPRQ